MSDSTAHALSVVLLVGLPAQSSLALTMVLEDQGKMAVEAPGPGVARMALAGSGAIDTVVCRCNEMAEDGTTLFPLWLAEHHGELGVVCLCNSVAHDHGQFPPACRVLRSPYDASDFARALAETRLDTFFQDSRG